MNTPAPTTSVTEVPSLGTITVPKGWFIGQSVGGDFVLRDKLGRGGLANVYLAHQQSLDRLVALKLPHDGGTVGTEGLALAGLEHDHIVKVYSEVVDSPTGTRGLCLQYVPGTSLEAVIPKLHSGERPQTGKQFLAIVDEVSTGQSAFDPTAIRDRQALETLDFYSSVCKLGEQIAHALAFTHDRGILHCDIKPGNILITRYGRPLLVDFNVALDTVRNSKENPSGMGGTLRYMSPEQFNVLFEHGEYSAVDGRTDIYSLGVVLFELATGGLPVKDRSDKWNLLPRELAMVLRRCLESNPEDRYPTAAALADALAATRRILLAQSRLPQLGWFGSLVVDQPIMMTFVMSLAPELVGSALNIAYNALQLKMNDEQLAVFPWVVGIYDVAAYFVCLWLAIKIVIGTGRKRDRALADPRSPGLADAARQGALSFGRTSILLGLLGWIPGAIVFPTVIDCLAGPLGIGVYGHFAVSFILSALVGIIYSFIGVQYVMLRGLYPYLHHPDHFDRHGVVKELNSATRLLGPFLILATLIPLAGAILLLAFSEETMTLGFRLMTVGLIVLGMVGVSVLMRSIDHLRKLASAWTDE